MYIAILTSEWFLSKTLYYYMHNHYLNVSSGTPCQIRIQFITRLRLLRNGRSRYRLLRFKFTNILWNAIPYFSKTVKKCWVRYFNFLRISISTSKLFMYKDSLNPARSLYFNSEVFFFIWFIRRYVYIHWYWSHHWQSYEKIN